MGSQELVSLVGRAFGVGSLAMRFDLRGFALTRPIVGIDTFASDGGAVTATASRTRQLPPCRLAGLLLPGHAGARVILHGPLASEDLRCAAPRASKACAVAQPQSGQGFETVFNSSATCPR